MEHRVRGCGHRCPAIQGMNRFGVDFVDFANNIVREFDSEARVVTRSKGE